MLSATNFLTSCSFYISGVLAFGSHKCKENKGSLTKKAIININQLSDLFIIIGIVS